MTVREYIGARYVPIFVGDWDNTKTYEPLSIVTNEGASYTSRQYVPTGIDIDNEDYWVLTGNYNAQVEAYREEVQTFDGRIDSLEGSVGSLESTIGDSTEGLIHDIDTLDETVGDSSNGLVKDVNDLKNYLNDFFLGVMNGTTHTLTLCKDAHGHSICIDCAGADDTASIRNYLTAQLGTNKLDAVIITHFHSDHYKGFGTVAEFCDSNTDIWVQMPATENNDEYSNTYVPAYTEVSNICTSNNLKTPLTPVNFSEHVYGDMKCKFFNTDESWRVIYDASWGQDNWEHPDQRISTLNNYSIVTLVSAYNATYLDTGDIEGAAEKQLAPYMQKVMVAKHPHHLWNRMGYELFYDRVNPEYWIATDHFRTGDQGYLLDSQFDTTYLFRYLIYNQNDINVVTNDQTDITCLMSNGQIKKMNGYYVDKDYSRLFEYTDNPTEKANQILFDAVIPPSVYYDNPYKARLLTTDDLWTLKTYMRGCPYFEFRIPTSMRGLYALRDELDALYEPTVLNVNIYLDFHQNPTVYPNSSNRRDTHIEFEYEYTSANAPANMRRYQHGFYPNKLAGPFSNGDTVSGGQWANMKLATVLTCKKDSSSGRAIPLINTRNDVSANTTGAGGDFSGCVLATGGGTIYAVKIDTDGKLHTDAVSISNGTVTHFDIYDLVVME